jgi:hypothetical protein
MTFMADKANIQTGGPHLHRSGTGEDRLPEMHSPEITRLHEPVDQR